MVSYIKLFTDYTRLERLLTTFFHENRGEAAWVRFQSLLVVEKHKIIKKTNQTTKLRVYLN